jgi:hypothetical protein
MSAKLVPTFADGWCSVVSATDPHGRYSLFSRPEDRTIRNIKTFNCLIVVRFERLNE